MISRRLLWVIGAGVAGLLLMTWWAGDYPAALTIINTSGAGMRNITITSGDNVIRIATLANGESRRFTLPPGDFVSVRCGGKGWRSSEKLGPAQAVVLYVLPGGRFEERSRLGTLAR